MPQELRQRNKVTGEVSEEIMKTLNVNNFLSDTGLRSLNISSEFIIQVIWPNMTRFDAELLLTGLSCIHGGVKDEEQR